MHHIEAGFLRNEQAFHHIGWPTITARVEYTAGSGFLSQRLPFPAIYLTTQTQAPFWIIGLIKTVFDAYKEEENVAKLILLLNPGTKTQWASLWLSRLERCFRDCPSRVSALLKSYTCNRIFFLEPYQFVYYFFGQPIGLCLEKVNKDCQLWYTDLISM